ncbi:MAG: diguanylate cyclase [Desulfobulbus sp.]|nr:diguanylate cyclase [Desulfobulbus sp.]
MQRTPTLLEAAYDVSRFLLQERDLANLLQGVCDRLTGPGAGQAALIVLLDSDSGGIITAETGFQDVLPPLVDGLQKGQLPDCSRRAMETEEGGLVFCEDCSCGLYSASEAGDNPLGLTLPIRCSSSLSGFLTLKFPAAFHSGSIDTAILTELVEALCVALRQLFADEAAKQRQQELELIEERYELALQASQAGLWDWNIGSGEMYTSPDHWELLDYRTDVANPSIPRRFIHPEDREQVLAVLNEHLAGKTDEYRIEYRVQEKNGEWTWFLDRGRVVERDANNMPVRMTGTHQNITLQKKQDQAVALVQQQLHEAVNHERNFLQTVIDSAGDPVMVIDLDYNVLLINQAAARLVCRKSEVGVLQGEKCYRLFNCGEKPCRDDRFPCPVARVMEQKKQVKMVHNPYHGNGVKNTFELEASPLLDRQGNLYGVIEVARDITDRLRIEKELRESQSHFYSLAHHDPLTELPNRLLFRDRLKQAVNKAERNRTRVAVLFLDLDRFKTINDTLGHDIGDALLKEVAIRLKRQCRQSDTVARFGGDEFVFVLEDINEHKDAGVVAEKIMVALAEPVQAKEHRIRVSTSIGIAHYPDDAGAIDEVIKCADLALYVAKEIGRSNYQFFRRDLPRSGSRPQLNAQQFGHAIAQGELFIEYQQRVALDDERVVGLQALPCWQHPTMGLLLPEAFIAAGHECDMLGPMADWMFSKMVEDMYAWKSQGRVCPPLTLACNARLLLDVCFLPMIRLLAKQYGLQPGMLIMELPEQVVIEATSQLVECLQQLNQLGVGLAISEFGGGRSIPLQLQSLPIQSVVLSQEVIEGIPHKKGANAMLLALVSFCHALGSTVVADGVERPEQQRVLVEMGCDQAQGSFFASPLRREQISDLLPVA